MNIKPEQLQNNLSNQLASIYFAFGAEILLVEQSLSLIKEAAKIMGIVSALDSILMATFPGMQYLI